MWLVLAFIGMGMLWSSQAEAACTMNNVSVGGAGHHLCTPDFASVNGLINNNSPSSWANGDSIHLTAASATWNSALQFPSGGKSASRTKMFKLLGAQDPNNTAGDTIITCSSTPCLTVWLKNGLAGLEIANIRWMQLGNCGGSLGGQKCSYAIWLAGHADTFASLFRIHHNWFQWQAAANYALAIQIGSLNSYDANSSDPQGTIGQDESHNYIYGLIDHNKFRSPFTRWGIQIEPIFSRRAGFWVPDNTCISGSSHCNRGFMGWADTAIIDHQGTFKNVVVEDNDVLNTAWEDKQAWMDGSGSSSYIVRHNILRNAFMANHGADSGFRSALWTEFSDNIIIIDSNLPPPGCPSTCTSTNGINTRGGSGVVFGNLFFDAAHKGAGNPKNITGTGNFTFLTNGIEYYRANDARGGDGICADAVAATDPKLGCDNKDLPNGWIARDQPGSARGAVQSGWAYGYRWATNPYVSWSNYFVSATEFPTPIAFQLNTGDFPALPNYVQNRRDIIENSDCVGHMGETICATFWDATNNKKLNYTAYTYPHPLQGAVGDPVPGPPSPPTGVTISRPYAPANLHVVKEVR